MYWLFGCFVYCILFTFSSPSPQIHCHPSPPCDLPKRKKKRKDKTRQEKQESSPKYDAYVLTRPWSNSQWLVPSRKLSPSLPTTLPEDISCEGLHFSIPAAFFFLLYFYFFCAFYIMYFDHIKFLFPFPLHLPSNPALPLK